MPLSNKLIRELCHEITVTIRHLFLSSGAACIHVEARWYHDPINIRDLKFDFTFRLEKDTKKIRLNRIIEFLRDDLRCTFDDNICDINKCVIIPLIFSDDCDITINGLLLGKPFSIRFIR